MERNWGDLMNVYAAMAHKGKMQGKGCFRVEAKDLWAAKVEAARIAKTKTEHVSVQLQVTADGRDVTGAIL